MFNRNGTSRAGLAMLLVAATFVMFPDACYAASRTLKLYNVHTKEKAEITYKRNGSYDSGGLKKISHLLRDWRRNEPTKMDPQLLDIVWEAYRQSGSNDYIHIISGYRSPGTNAMLRRTRGGQAKKSQHMLGKAMDFYIPGVKLSKLREIGFKLQGGGVGYYPRSGSPFVHFDTGNVRAWPRMSRQELARVFPKGGTLHLPASGNPLPGYQTAMAEYKARKAKGIAYAGGSATSGGSGGGGFLASLFGGGNDEEEDNAETAIAQASAGASQRVEPAAPVVAQPVEQTPGQLLAALPATAVPLPTAAPRRAGAPVPPADIPAAAPAETAVASASPLPVSDDVAAVLAAANVPLPTARPRDRDAETQQSSTVLALAAEPAASNDGVDALADGMRSGVPLPVRRPASDDAATLLAALDGKRRSDTQDDTSRLRTAGVPELASASPSNDAISFAASSGSPRNERLITRNEKTELAMTDIPTSRRIRADMALQTAGNGGETGTTSRPSKADAAALEDQRRQAMIQLDNVDQARWAIKMGAPRVQKKAAEATRYLRTPPRQMVLTAFTQETQPQVPNAFSGNAINFQKVARFER